MSKDFQSAPFSSVKALPGIRWWQLQWTWHHPSLCSNHRPESSTAVPMVLFCLHSSQIFKFSTHLHSHLKNRLHSKVNTYISIHIYIVCIHYLISVRANTTRRIYWFVQKWKIIRGTLYKQLLRSCWHLRDPGKTLWVENVERNTFIPKSMTL